MSKARETVAAHNVRRELLPNQSTALLTELHLLTRTGDLNADARRKLKQVNHLVGLITPALDDVRERFEAPQVVDVGAGNSYLGFIVYELFFKDGATGTVTNVESRPELIERAKERAERLSFTGMQFARGTIADAKYPDKIHVLTALHACDTATDDAIAVGIAHQADHIAVVPCCQAEVAQLLKTSRAECRDDVATLFEHPWHRREFGSHLTNVIRALVLESHGYSVTVTELAGWEHSLKNELILAKKVQRDPREPRKRLAALLSSLPIRPKLVRTLMPTP